MARVAATISTSAMMTGMGNPRKDPVPMKISTGSAKVTMDPSVTNCARPRPATISTSVATIGCMSRNVTRIPFQRPQRSPITSAATTANPAGKPATTIVAATAPEMAMTAPTERSTPLVAITAVIPMARIATGAPRFSTSIRLPNRRPSCQVTLKKPGKSSQLMRRTAPRARNCGLMAPEDRRRFMPAPRLSRRWSGRSSRA